MTPPRRQRPLRAPLLLALPLLASPLGAPAQARPAAATPAASQDADAPAIPSPADHLGRPVGTDFQLADWEDTRTYYEALAAASDRVVMRTLGPTTEGRDFCEVLISSAANLARLDDVKRWNQMLADPRRWNAAALEEAVESGPVVLGVSCSMHSTEVAGTEFGMQFAYLLATSDEEPWASAREQCVVVLFPTLNPDGLDEVVHWYRRTVDTPHEASSQLRLYQKYAGHDNNRDWFMLTQNETRMVTRELYQVWRPQVYWDVHQQGSTRERFFVPPFRDPLDPNLDPGVMTGIDVVGSRALFDMTREGLTGVSTGVSYDMWWNGGNRNVPVRHNIIGLLTEAASADLATPKFLPIGELSPPRGLGAYAPSMRFPAPWPGGWWRVGDIIEYELAFGRSLLGSLARERTTWRRNALEAAQRAVEAGRGEGVRGWLIPADTPDPDAAQRLVSVLLQSGVEVHRTTDALTLDGRTWPANSLVLRRDQPYGAYLKDLMEVQRYPEGDAPYDVAGWTLPLLLGVERVEFMEPAPEGLPEVRQAREVAELLSGDPRLRGIPRGWRSLAHSSTWAGVWRDLESGAPTTFVRAGERAGLVVPGAQAANLDEEPLVLDAAPRVGLYAPWQGYMPEGWMRWFLDTWGLPYASVRNENLRAGRLDDWLDVLVLPGNSGRALDGGRAAGSVPERYTGGLDPEGAVAVEEFVRGGGVLVACAGSCDWVVDLLGLPLVDAAADEGFRCPGSVLRAVPEQTLWTAGLPERVAVQFSSGGAWRPMTEAEREAAGREAAPDLEVLLRYAPTRTLLSGWIQGEEHIAGEAAWLTVPYGAGRVHLFGFQPQYRGWSQQAFGLLVRALLLNG